MGQRFGEFPRIRLRGQMQGSGDTLSGDISCPRVALGRCNGSRVWGDPDMNWPIAVPSSYVLWWPLFCQHVISIFPFSRVYVSPRWSSCFLLTLFGGEDWSLAPFSLVSVKGQSRSVFWFCYHTVLAKLFRGLWPLWLRLWDLQWLLEWVKGLFF